jgi:hypothetical protein
MLFRSSSLATSFATSILFLAVPSSGQITPPPQRSGAASAARRSCSEYESTYAQHNSWRQNGWSVRVWLELTRLSLLLQLLVSSALSPERFLERRYSLVRWASLIFFFRSSWLQLMVGLTLKMTVYLAAKIVSMYARKTTRLSTKARNRNTAQADLLRCGLVPMRLAWWTSLLSQSISIIRRDTMEHALIRRAFL